MINIGRSLASTRNPPSLRKRKISFSKKAFVSFCIVISFISVFSLIFIGAELPFPTTIIMLVLVTNSMFGFFSLIFHKLTIILYEANVYHTSESVTSYIYKFIAIFLSGINYYVQITLDRMPLLVNKLFAILFLLLLIWCVIQQFYFILVEVA